MAKNMLPRICRLCGASFSGGPRAWYCPSCRHERRLESDRRMREKRKTLDHIPLGSVIHCEICGANIIKTSGRKSYCAECAAKHLKEVDNKQSLDWKAKNPEKYKAGKRRFAMARQSDDGKKSGIAGIFWDKQSRKWRVELSVNNKQIHVAYCSDLETAKQKRNEFLHKMNETAKIDNSKDKGDRTL